MKKILWWSIVVLIVAAMISAFSLSACKAAVEEAVEEVAEEVEEVAEEVEEAVTDGIFPDWDALADEEITIIINEWGDAEAPGMNAWWEETAQLYMDMHPNVIVEPLEIPIEDIQQAWMAAVAAGDPPSIQLMGRQEGIDAATAGDILPIEDFWTEDEVNHILPSARRELGWGGKLWLVPEYMDPWHMIYNKKIFTEAGLDPEAPPETWAEFMEMGDAIVAAGYIPMSNGWLDGYMSPWWMCLVALQSLDDPSDIHQATLGEQSFADPKHADWWNILVEATDKGFFNEDQASLDFISGIDLFSTGEVAMVMVVQPMVRQYVDILGEDVVGVMKTPMPDIQGDLAGTVPIPAMPLALAANADYPEVAADVLRFIHTADRVNALYAHSTAMQANDLFDPTLVTDPRDQLIAQWFLEAPGYCYNWHYTPQIEAVGYTLGGLIVTGEITAEEAGQMMDDAAEKWRDDNPEMVEIFRDIAEEWAMQ